MAVTRRVRTVCGRSRAGGQASSDGARRAGGNGASGVGVARGLVLAEVLVGMVIGLAIVGMVMVAARAQARMHAGIETHLDGERAVALVDRVLDADVERVPAVGLAGMVQVVGGGEGVDLVVQMAPARVHGARIERPVARVEYRALRSGQMLVRREAGRLDVFRLEGVRGLRFAQHGVGPGRGDVLVVRGRAGRREFELTFGRGAASGRRLEWQSLLGRLETGSDRDP